MAHEDLTREREVEASSDRSFGVVFALVFLLIAGWPLIRGQTPRWWAIGLAAACAAIAVLKPTLLSKFNQLWTKLGVLLGRAVGPVALGVLFYLILIPTGLLMRLSGKDPLRLKLDAAAESYWIRREPPGPPPNSMTNQF